MASVCCFVKPYFIGIPLKYYLNYNVRHKCIFKFNYGRNIFSRNPCANIRNVLKEILTYNHSNPCTRRAFIQPILTSPNFSSSFFVKNYVQRDPRSSVFQNITCRSYCTSDKSSNFPTMLGLADLPAITSPSFFYSIRNWLVSTVIMRMHLDEEFDLDKFAKAASKAVELVTVRLSQSDYSNLEGLLSEDLLSKIKDILSPCSVAQRQELAMDLKDVVFQYSYEIGLIFNESNENEEEPKRFVEITMCYHILKGYAEMMAKVAESASPFNIKIPEADKVYIINCRFIREYTKGVEDEWTINAFNYFVLSDIVNA